MTPEKGDGSMFEWNQLGSARGGAAPSSTYAEISAAAISAYAREEGMWCLEVVVTEGGRRR